MRIKEIAKENRPRERLQRLGPEALSSAELLAIILQKGTKNENVIDMSNRLISKYGMDKLSDASLQELQETVGIGQAKAMQIKALFEFNKRHKIAKSKVKRIKTAKDVFDLFSDRLKDEKQEKFIVLALNGKNGILGEDIISKGSLDNVTIQPREVFKSAIKNSASKIVLIHNHPSGDPNPSDTDNSITERLMEAGNVLGIVVQDHVIIGAGKWWSWRESSV
jgi:DNA repair protein RadC